MSPYINFAANFQLSSYLLDVTLKNKYENPQDKVQRNDLVEAMELLKDWPPMTRSVFSKTADKAHRTLLKKKYGVKTGTVTNITCFQVGYAKMSTDWLRKS